MQGPQQGPQRGGTTGSQQHTSGSTLHASSGRASTRAAAQESVAAAEHCGRPTTLPCQQTHQACDSAAVCVCTHVTTAHGKTTPLYQPKPKNKGTVSSTDTKPVVLKRCVLALLDVHTHTTTTTQQQGTALPTTSPPTPILCTIVRTHTRPGPRAAASTTPTCEVYAVDLVARQNHWLGVTRPEAPHAVPAAHRRRSPPRSSTHTCSLNEPGCRCWFCADAASSRCCQQQLLCIGGCIGGAVCVSGVRICEQRLNV